jgi:hypothetical protein
MRRTYFMGKVGEIERGESRKEAMKEDWRAGGVDECVSLPDLRQLEPG